MAASSFAKVMPHVFAHEGGYVFHKADPGGATNFGITARTLGAWRKLGRAATPAEVRALTKSEASDIYKAQYWGAIRGNDLPAGVDYAVMDYAVNSGTVRAAKALQAAVGAKQDGHIGINTIAAAKAADPAQTVNRICDGRMAFLRGLKTFPTFGKGWTRRVSEVRKVALSLT